MPSEKPRRLTSLDGEHTKSNQMQDEIAVGSVQKELPKGPQDQMHWSI